MLGSVMERIGYFYQQGGPFMPVLVLEAMLLWYALGYRMVALRRGSLKPVRALVRLYSRDDTSRRPAPRGIVDGAVAQGIETARRVRSNLRSHLDVALVDKDRELDRFASLADGIVVIAPLTGLLGTVSGMIETFDSLADMALFSQSGGIAGGISEALFTTQMGLAVAIPGLLMGRMLKRRQASLEQELELVKDVLCTTAEVAP
jgi:biopolymer transport protein ExbB